MPNIPLGKLEAPLHPAVQEFAGGIGDARPEPTVVETAQRITLAAIEKTIEPEISVDVDGALSFDLRLANGLLLMAELAVNGELDAGIIDDKQGAIVERLRDTTSEELIRCF